MRPRFIHLAFTLLVAAPGCAAQQSAETAPATFWAFTGPWDPQSDASVRAHGGLLDAIVTGWIGLDSVSGRPLLPPPYTDSIRTGNAAVARMAIVTSWHRDRFHPAPIRRLGVDRTALARTAGEIARHASSSRYTGLVFDFELLEPRDLDAQLRVMKAIADSARARGVTTFAAAVPATDTAGYPARPLLSVVDAIIPMLYDQHWTGSVPGPISAREWVRGALALRVAEAGPQGIVAGLPTYGYRWRKGQPAESISYTQAQAIAARSRAPLQRDTASGTLRARHAEGWEMWVTDAALLRDLVRDAERAGVRRFALWRLGQEDPAIWGTVIR